MVLKKGLFFLILWANCEGASPSLEYQVKAAYLFNFLKFVEWPWNELHADSSSPIQVAVVGKDPFKGILAEFKKEKIWSRKIKVDYLTASDPLDKYHMIFITKEIQKTIPSILEKLKEKPVLTVGENENFIRNGGIIEFTLKEENVKFSVNLLRARAIGLYINSNLLKLAEDVFK